MIHETFLRLVTTSFFHVCVFTNVFHEAFHEALLFLFLLILLKVSAIHYCFYYCYSLFTTVIVITIGTAIISIITPTHDKE